MAVSPKDTAFLLKAAVISLLILAFLHIVQPFIQPPSPDAARITEVARSVVPVRGGDVPAMLRNKEGKNTVLFIYASWCSYCRQMMPDIIDMLKDGQMKDSSVVFLSLDRQFGALASYLVQNRYESLFTPYAVKMSSFSPLSQALVPSGSSYTGAIPYFAVFNSRGFLLSEQFGVATRRQLQQMIRPRG